MTGCWQGLDVLALVADENAVGRYRVLNPLMCLARAGARCRWSLHLPSRDDLSAADLIIAQRQHDPRVLSALREVRARGKTVIFEIDDNLAELPDDNPVRQLFLPGSTALAGIAEATELADGVVVSTRELAAAVTRRDNAVRVVPNCIDFDLRDWRTRPADKDPSVLVVGWAGGATHAADIELLRTVVPAILRRHPRVRFGLYSTPGMVQLVSSTWGLDPGRLLVVPARPFDAYPGGLPHFDIGLAPLRSNAFNVCKSNLKVLEYGAWGIPVVASAIAPYSRTIEDGVDGFLAASPGEWLDRTEALIEDRPRRETMGSALERKVRAEFDLGRNWPRWPEAWSELAALGTGADREPVGATVAAAPNQRTGRNDLCPCGSRRKYKHCCLPR